MNQPYFVTWYLPNQVLYVRVQRQLENAESEQVDKQLCALLDEGQNVYLIMDLRTITNVKNPSLARLDHVAYRHHPNLQWMLILTNNQIMHFLSTAASQMAQKSFRVFAAVDELHLFLKKNLPDAPWEQAKDDLI